MENEEIKTGKGWLELSKTVEVKTPFTIDDWKEMCNLIQESREEEYKRVSKMEKETNKSIREICKKHNCTFEELPLELQSVFIQNSMGITPMFGKRWFDNFKEKYPEFAYLI